MSVSYTKEHKDQAEAAGLSLVTIAVSGMEFQGRCDAQETQEVMNFLATFVKKRAERRRTEEAHKGDHKPKEKP